MNNNKITIGVPVYNGEETIKRCVSSIQNQTYRDIEILLANDGSTDNSLNICKRLALNDNRISIIETTHKGVSAARNLIINKATGDYICFVDADDYLLPHHIEMLISQIKDEKTLIATTYITSGGV